jgi:hypothetical protein
MFLFLDVRSEAVRRWCLEVGHAPGVLLTRRQVGFACRPPDTGVTDPCTPVSELSLNVGCTDAVVHFVTQVAKIGLQRAA